MKRSDDAPFHACSACGEVATVELADAFDRVHEAIHSLEQEGKVRWTGRTRVGSDGGPRKVWEAVPVEAEA